MIVFDLECRAGGHRFEGWFGSSGDFDSQQQRGLLCCPQCGSAEVVKAPMAPNVGRKGNQAAEAAAPATANPPVPVAGQAMSPSALPAEAVKMMQALATMQAEALKSSRWVGGDFAEQSRAMHYGEQTAESIHGQATPEEAKELLEEGIAVAPLLVPFVPPEQSN